MNEMKVIFNDPNEILEFVNKVSKYPYAMDMQRGRCVVDAKSILGIINLGLRNEIDLKVYAEQCEDMKAEIAHFVAA